MRDGIQFEHIRDDEALTEFCNRNRETRFLGFDTEFVSENRYRPELCLLQIATDSEFAIVDTLTVDNIDEFWQWLTTGQHVTVVHAAREEFLFCFRAVGRRPQNLFDVQLAAGMIGMEYPASYGNLVSRLLGKRVDKGETRTDWRKRPLSKRQMDYALSDVIHLKGLYNRLSKKLDQLVRTEWYLEESRAWQTGLEESETTPQWHRVAGITNLNRRALGIIKELWLLRDEEAQRRNRSPKRVLPDDLIVELSKRGTSDPNRLKAIRGFESRVAKNLTQPISNAIERGNQIPDNELPEKMQRSRTTNLGMLGQFLVSVLNIICREKKIAPPIVGTSQELRNFAAWKLGMVKLDEDPKLSQGWRREVVGQVIDDVLKGKIAIRVQNPKSDNPLRLENL
ncbi:MAG: HRDC domain-containing protein [Planctomycetota bacterium]